VEACVDILGGPVIAIDARGRAFSAAGMKAELISAGLKTAF
jgi:hypothetical protein